jgi:predicted DNA-binding antitoxin AbrB/MazE fold protein
MIDFSISKLHKRAAVVTALAPAFANRRAGIGVRTAGRSGPVITAVKAIYEDGVFEPLEPLDLEELTQVEVLIPTAATADAREPSDSSTIDDSSALFQTPHLIWPSITIFISTATRTSDISRHELSLRFVIGER